MRKQPSAKVRHVIARCSNTPMMRCSWKTSRIEILDVNPRACELLGYSREESLALKVSDLQSPERRGPRGSVIKGELARSGGTVFEGVDVRRDGTRIPVEISTSQIGDSGLVLAIVRDITERTRAEAALRESAGARAQSVAQSAHHGRGRGRADHVHRSGPTSSGARLSWHARSWALNVAPSSCSTRPTSACAARTAPTFRARPPTNKRRTSRPIVWQRSSVPTQSRGWWKRRSTPIAKAVNATRAARVGWRRP